MASIRKSLPNCSTPKASPSNRRRTLGIVSPQGIKRSEPMEDSLLIVNEDEAEKKAHRKSLALQSFQKTPAVLSSPNLAKTISMTPLCGPRLNADQLKQHYADCIKLSTENKINAKNAFGLHLLEYIDTILQEKSDNFQVVGCTIDAGAKIYAGRVDAVHGDILKMLGTMGNADVGADEDKADDEGGEQEEGAKKKGKKKKKITLCEGRTIEKNLANIRNTTYDLSFDVDPLIQITTRQSDEQSTAALISYNVFLKNDSLLFDSTSVYHTQTDTQTDITDLPTIDTSHMQDLIPPLMNTDRVICPAFDGFRFNNWVCTEEKSFYEPASSQQTQESENTEPFVPGIEADMIDEPLDDFGVDVVSSGDEEGGMKVEKASQKQKLTIDDLTLALEPTEYGYFNPRLAQMWAGPGHWKLKPLVAKNEGEKKERKKKVLTMHTFETSEDDLFKHFIKSRAKTTLANETLRSNRTSNNILPLDIRYLESSLRKLSMMPLWRGKLAEDKIVSSGEASDKEWYNYNNPHDLSNYCPNNPDASDDDVGGGEISYGSPGPANTTPIGDLELIDAAPRIERINIHYAKQAKRIDVKKLKRVMWRSIAPSQNEEAENMIKNKEIISANSDDKLKSGPVNFSDIYKKIPSQVSVIMSENLSVPIAFACLLHLANEHGLQLTDKKDLSDIEIVVPPEV